MSHNGYQNVDYQPIGVEDTILAENKGDEMKKLSKQVFMLETSNSPSTTLYSKIYNKLNGIVFLLAVSVVSCLVLVNLGNTTPIMMNDQSSDSSGSIDSQGRYIMRNYDLQKPMSNFLNGIAGQWGVPMWAFYVNRGQGITSFGRQNKDGGIAKFLTAEKAYQQSPFTGFRTILKGKRAIGNDGQAESWNYMPFFPRTAEDVMSSAKEGGTNPALTRNLMIGLNEFEIEEVHRDKKLQTNIVYFSMPNEDFPSLVRMTTLTNLDQDRDLTLEVLDGLARLEPSGLGNGDLDAMGRTLEAWMNVYNVGNTDTLLSSSDVPQSWEEPSIHDPVRPAEDTEKPEWHDPVRPAGPRDEPMRPPRQTSLSQQTSTLRGAEKITPNHIATVPPKQRNLQSKGYNIVQPFYHISQGTADTPQVQIIKDGHFVLSFLQQDIDDDSDDNNDGLYPLLPFIVDPNVVFGYDTTLTRPIEFFASNVTTLLNKKQCTTSRTPCGYSSVESIVIPAGKNITIVSVYGHSSNLEQFVSTISPKLRAKNFVLNKRSEARQLVVDITSKVASNTSSAILNQYIKQNFLDNLLRGGLPIVLGGTREDGGVGEINASGADNNDDTPATSANRVLRESEENGKSGVSTPAAPSASPSFAAVKLFNNNTFQSKVFHTFSRIHGDIERDYNFFQIDTTYYSQGPGNFRDVAQNRRCDVFHTPAVEDFNIIMFLSFVQADGYNPLTVAGTNFRVPAAHVDTVIQFMNLTNPTTDTTIMQTILGSPFRPGQLFTNMRSAGVQYSVSREALLAKVIFLSEQTFAAQYAQNGFWTDHWTYTLDLVDNYLSVYPDNEENMLFHSAPVPFYMSPAYVKTRAQRYSLVNDVNNPGTSTVRMYNAITAWGDAAFSPARMGAMNAVFTDATNYNIDVYGAANVWQRNAADNSVATVSVFGKLLVLAIIKYSTMDSAGMGVEMEGGKPGWNDAMNGLPGLLGSGMPETFEMLRIVQYLIGALQRYGTRATIRLPIEFNTFMVATGVNLDTYNAEMRSSSFDITTSEFNLWNRNNNMREQYRASVLATFSGQTAIVVNADLLALLSKIQVKVQAGIQRAIATRNGIDTSNVLTPTYFYYDCTDFVMLPVTAVTIPAQSTMIQVKKFTQRNLPLFLEGPTRHLKVVKNIEDRRAIYAAVKASAIYDKELSMYKLSAPLAGIPQEIGRLMAFSPGWLENQSVWLHMSYKFYLELLRGGLYEEFYTEIATGLAPFMDPKVYGRSPVEAASFIVSSVFPDASLHGSSFLARLSGSTAEFLSMWSLMMAGEQPFSVDADNNLTLQFTPKLPAWLFNSDNTLSFTFLGVIQVTYHNPSAQNTWLSTASSYTLTDASGMQTEIDGASLTGDLAVRVRNLEFKSIDVIL